jgi:hypothetical protein
MSEILLTLALISVLAFLYVYNKDIAKERQQLYDRIHAKDFIEFKQITEPIETKPKEEKENAYVEL